MALKNDSKCALFVLCTSMCDGVSYDDMDSQSKEKQRKAKPEKGRKRSLGKAQASDMVSLPYESSIDVYCFAADHQIVVKRCEAEWLLKCIVTKLNASDTWDGKLWESSDYDYFHVPAWQCGLHV